MFFFFFLTVVASPLEEGDALWKYPTYHRAIEKWKEARDSHEMAISIMAQYRLLLISPSILFPIELIRIDHELGNCDVEDPSCLLARVDREIILGALRYPIQQEFVEDLLSYLNDRIPDEVQTRRSWLKAMSSPQEETAQAGPFLRGPGAPSIFLIG